MQVASMFKQLAWNVVEAVAIELSLLGYAFVRAAEFHMRLEADQRYLEAFESLLPRKVLQAERVPLSVYLKIYDYIELYII